METMKKEKGITRAQYKSLKRMDHKKMEGFIKNLYTEGYKEGKKAAQPSVKPSDIAEVLVGVEGIGIKKAAEIMKVINKLYAEKLEEIENGRIEGSKRNNSDNY